MRSPFLAPLLVVVVLTGCKDPGPKTPPVGDLTTMLESGDPEVQREAAHWVIQEGPKAADAAPALAKALKSPDMSVRISVALALGKLGPDAAATSVPALTAALNDAEIPVRQAAADALGKLGPAASSAIPALEKVAAEPVKCNTASDAIKKIRS